MSSNQRPHTNVGAGTLREPDEDKFTVNEGWSFFQQYLPDNSVIDSEPFSYNLIGIEGNGPYTVHIPAMPDMFLDPASLRLQGTCRIKYVKNNKKEDSLPKRPAYPLPKSLQEPKFELKFTHIVEGKANKHTKTPVDLVTDKHIPITVTDAAGANPKTEFYKISVVNSTAKETEGTLVVPVNLMCQAMWKDIEIKLNSRTVTKNANLEYATKAYLETILTYGNDALNTHLQSEMWHPDSASEVKDKEYEIKLKKFATNEIKNRKYCRDQDFSFCMQLHTEFNSINGFIMDQMPYTFTFVRNDPSFFLRTDEKEESCNTGYYTVDFSSLKLTGNFLKPSPEVYNQYRAHLASDTPFLYQTTRTDILTSQIQSGATNFDWNSIFASDMLPDTIYVCMVDMNAKNGAWHKDPFNFQHYGVSSIHLRINNRNLPVEPLTPTWKNEDNKNDDQMLAFKQLYENCSVKLNNVGLSITPEKFQYGSTIFAWDLNHDQCAGAHANHGDLVGSASIHMVFRKAIEQNVCVIVAGVFRDYLAINNERKPNVLTSYGVEKYYEQLGLPVPKYKREL